MCVDPRARCFAIRLFTLCTACAVLPACGCEDGAEPSVKESAVTTPDHETGRLTDVTAEIGLPERDRVWPDGAFMATEIIPGGVALFDFDADGDLDIYHVRHPPPGPLDEAASATARNRLYAQNSDGTFQLVAGTGLDDDGYGYGAIVGDVDNDGDDDVFVTNLGRDRLFVNDGSGTFRDVSESAGIVANDWSTGASFIDYDRDGDLDLFVAHYVVFDFEKVCRDGEGRRVYCPPRQYPATRDRLYRNDSVDGIVRFTDVTAAAGLTAETRGLGVLCVDLTDDAYPDIYVANDAGPNRLWINRRDGTFSEQAARHNVAYNGAGLPEASMGVAVGDVNADGDLDLFVTHEHQETNTLYAGTPGGTFVDRSASSGMSKVDLRYTGWGCALVDLDHDGDLDAPVVNGRISPRQAEPGGEALGAFWQRYAEPNLLFLNDGTGRMTSVRAGDFTRQVDNGRALALGDLDRDGDLDLVVAHVDNHLIVYRNEMAPTNRHWLRVRARTGGRDAIGARVELVRNETAQVQFIQPASSYLANHEPAAHFGLGESAAAPTIHVTWPDGRRSTHAAPGVDRVVVIQQQ